MPKYQVNDKVSFLNEKRNGVIKSIKENGIYIIESEDGFEIDAQEKELVLIKQTEAKKNIEKPITVPVPLSFIKNIPGISNGLWLLSCPAEEGMVLTGPADFYFVNSSSNDALVAVSLKFGKKITGISSFNLKPREEIKITTLNREHSNDSFYFQVIFHKTGIYDPQKPLSRSMSINFPDLVSADSKLNAPYAFCRYDCIANPTSQEENLFSKHTIDNLREALRTNSGKAPQLHSKSKVYIDKEVDLHIEEFTDSIEGMTNAEIIAMQLDHFRYKLNQALLHGASRIIFIHGVGDGKLKAAIRKDLLELNIRFFDAAPERYGNGATEIVL